MDIWGPPSYYSSSYSDSQYYKYKEEYEENIKKAISANDLCKGIALDLKRHIAKLDTTRVVGWEVKHRFRCKTKGGSPDIGDYRYVLDKDFKKIIIQEDTDDDEMLAIRAAMKAVVDGYFDE